jgi:hypothetical protein
LKLIQFGAGGRTRTGTTFYGPRILSPVRLPFRHTGNLDSIEFLIVHHSQLNIATLAWYADRPSLFVAILIRVTSIRRFSTSASSAIRGLWERNRTFVARIAMETDGGDKQNRWVPLAGAEIVAQAQEQLKTLHVDRTRNDLPVLKRTPKFADYAAQYLAYFDTVTDAKRPSTIQKERGAIKLWTAHIGGLRLDKIHGIHINSFIEKRQAEKISGRTVNLDIIVLRNVLKRAIDDQWIKTLPTENLRPLKWTPRKRNLITQTEIDKICEAALEVSKTVVNFRIMSC